MNRFYKRATERRHASRGRCTRVGLLFGLGFDTATEIALLATAGAAAAGGLPIYAILCLPILFAAGMSLLDTIDGAFMNFAYGWAFAKPVRKVFYNITITWLSVVVALVIGTIELMSVLADKLSLTGQPWDFVSGLDLNYVGYAIVGAVRPHLGRRARGLALRPDRGEVVGSASDARRRARSAPRAEHLHDDRVAAGRRRPSSTDIDEWSSCCAKRAPRLAPCRIVLHALFAADGPISAQLIVGPGAGRRRPVEQHSVYRNLERLEGARRRPARAPRPRPRACTCSSAPASASSWPASAAAA